MYLYKHIMCVFGKGERDQYLYIFYRRGRQKQAEEEEVDSEDSNAVDNESDPDYEDFFHDEVDDFHDDQEKV